MKTKLEKELEALKPTHDARKKIEELKERQKFDEMFDLIFEVEKND